MLVKQTLFLNSIFLTCVFMITSAHASTFEIDQDIQSVYICDSQNTCRLTSLSGEDQLLFEFVGDNPETRSFGGREFLGHEIQLSNRWHGRILDDQRIFIPEDEVIRLFNTRTLPSGIEEMTALSRNGVDIVRDLRCRHHQDIHTPLSQFHQSTTERQAQNHSSGNGESCLIEGFDEQMTENCLALLDSDIPQDALMYALDVLNRNSSEFRTRECYEVQDSSHYSMEGVTRESFEERMSEGLPNKCQFVINDTRSPWDENSGLPYRGNMYYIDICSDDGPSIHHDYFNLGTGTGANRDNWRNECGQRNTNMGAFFTNYESFNFANNNSAYQGAAREQRQACEERQRQGLETFAENCSNRKSSVQLFGLQNTNSTAAQCNKYMHISPYNSSWGCPSISPENYWMIEQLAENGPSLVLNYHDDLEELDQCE